MACAAGGFVPLWLPELRKARTALSAAGIQVLEFRFAPSHIDVEILNGFGVKRSQTGQGFDCCAGHKRIPPLIAFAVYVLEMGKALYRPTRNMCRIADNDYMSLVAQYGTNAKSRMTAD